MYNELQKLVERLLVVQGESIVKPSDYQFGPLQIKVEIQKNLTDSQKISC